jgi:predicted ArsR family transcriptional regulator
MRKGGTVGIEVTRMDASDPSEAVPGPDEEPPEFDDWDSPEAVLTDGPIRERLLDVLLQVREPTRVATIAERVDCDPETAREYLRWFASLGIAREHAGRPVRYERNESYLFWRRVERIRERYSEEGIVEELSAAVEAIESFRDRFDAESPGAVSLVDSDGEETVEARWEALSEWKTLERRAALLDAARRDPPSPDGRIGSIDA